MDSFKKCGFLVTSCFLLLTLLGDPAEACSCEWFHPQTEYCELDFVIRAKFMGKSQESEFMLRYEIKTTKVYKRSEAMPEIRFLSTAKYDTMCGYELHEPFGKQEYLITGHVIKNVAHISLCNLIEPWAELSPEKQRGMSGQYSKGCGCTIEACYRTACPGANSGCMWYKGLYYSNYKKNEAVENKVCLPKSKTSASCSWQSLKR